MTESVDLVWSDGMSFTADIGGYKIILDSDPEFGGQKKGPKPKPLMMVALAGCTGMDVVSLLKKMRVDFSTFNVRVEGDLSEEHPKKFEKMKIIYELSGNSIDRTKVEKAVALSQEKYCGVSVSYRASMDISHEIIIKETGG
jgi:putative redox protein